MMDNIVLKLFKIDSYDFYYNVGFNLHFTSKIPERYIHL